MWIEFFNVFDLSEEWAFGGGDLLGEATFIVLVVVEASDRGNLVLRNLGEDNGFRERGKGCEDGGGGVVNLVWFSEGFLFNFFVVVVVMEDLDLSLLWDCDDDDDDNGGGGEEEVDNDDDGIVVRERDFLVIKGLSLSFILSCELSSFSIFCGESEGVRSRLFFGGEREKEGSGGRGIPWLSFIGESDGVRSRFSSFFDIILVEVDAGITQEIIVSWHRNSGEEEMAVISLLGWWFFVVEFDVAVVVVVVVVVDFFVFFLEDLVDLEDLEFLLFFLFLLELPYSL